MASELKNLSVPAGSDAGSAANLKFAIVTAEWNYDITNALRNGAKNTLLQYGALEKDIIEHWVPGSFELTLGAQYMAEYVEVDAIICLGCVIQGETRHFDFICDAVANGLTQLSIAIKKPVIFGVLTPDNMQQALDRAGGKHGNKGDEAAITAIKMLQLRKSLDKPKKQIGF